jgi:hypothetical protein
MDYHLKSNFTKHISFLYDRHERDLFKIGPRFDFLFRLMYSTITLSNLCSNGLIIYIIVRKKSMHKVTNFFIINLALADILTSICSTPFQVKYLFLFYRLPF